jgi:hypothetical protein
MTVADGAEIVTVRAVVAEVIDDQATLLMGDDQEPWDFPIEMLPPSAEQGSFLLIQMQNGHPIRAELHRENEEMARKGLDHRLARLARYEQLTGHEVRIS